MERWKINLVVLWFGQFMVMSGMTMIVPFLPLYLQQDLGMTDPHQVSTWAGIIFAGNFVTAFIFQPIWGGIADRYGRKMMLLRSGFGMAIVMVLMGFATSAWQLLGLRLLNGVISGYMPAAVALMSTNTPKQKMGFALGTLQSGAVAGSILGPFIGGLLADAVGFRSIFYITGSLLILGTVLSWIFVKEKFDAAEAAKKPKISIMKAWANLQHIKQLPALYAVTLMIQFAMQSSLPLMPLFVAELLNGRTENLAFLAGFVSSITGFSNMIASPLIGKWSDRIGSEKILFICLIGTGLSFIPQALVTSVWQLFIARFFLGIFLGGLLPTVNTLIRKYTPSGMESRSYSFNSSFLSLGNMIGPIFGGFISGYIGGIRGVFYFTTIMLLVNALWAYFTLVRSKSASLHSGDR
jgi:MFS transporter, DHA1 family, multidrug resistance protein